MDSIAVYCGSATGNSEAYIETARQLGGQLADRGINLVYGGGNVGLMGVVADACLAGGGTVTGVIPEQLVDLELSHPGLTSLEVVETMAQRKTRMEDLADGYVCLPGGVGTLEELAEVLTMQQLGHVDGPVGLVDVAGFWRPFVDMYAGMSEAGFVQRRFVDAIVLEPTPAQVLDAFAGWTNPGMKWDNK
ncbi:TIGR00730 family Rossman fold protein [Corynebacterium simulans]|uniref:LOG family protein n=1 Tax=Corynebacterium simulans TaxID=146827 RepID=UPI00254AF8D4|nr:TIGR00730 family Rossman fold protein [Corynebacterium simulans]MDK7139114.1 TIGR00730 family Rossman fold protein [Corynebacterium simulans]